MPLPPPKGASAEDVLLDQIQGSIAILRSEIEQSLEDKLVFACAIASTIKDDTDFFSTDAGKSVRNSLLRLVIEHQTREISRHKTSDEYWGSAEAIEEDNKIWPIVNAALGIDLEMDRDWSLYALKATSDELCAYIIERCQTALQSTASSEVNHGF